MTDVLLEVNEDGPDFVLEDGDLAVDEGLVTAALLSIFVDRRADPSDQLPESEQDPRGWCLEPVGDRWGSRLWLLERAKATAASGALAREALLQASLWMIEEGMASDVDARAEVQAGGLLALELDVTRGTSRRWSTLWDAVRAGSVERAFGGATARILFR